MSAITGIIFQNVQCFNALNADSYFNANFCSHSPILSLFIADNPQAYKTNAFNFAIGMYDQKNKIYTLLYMYSFGIYYLLLSVGSNI